jgi:polysaccharide export outer membrane protein
VKKPGLYPRRPGLTIMDAIGMADGYTIYAVLRNTAVIRTTNSQNSEILVANLDKLIKDGNISQNIPLANNDIVYVPRSLIGDWNVFIEKIRPTVQLISIPLSAAVTIKLLD